MYRIILNLKQIPSPILTLGFASFFINIATVILFSLSGVYLRNMLGVSSDWIGFLEGVVEAFSYLIKLFSGVLSDLLLKRKLIILIGVALTLLARPLIGISASFWGVFIGRLCDRLGNGMQATPRDTLVGELAPPSSRGACFGMRQALATSGSFIGAILGIVLMKLTNNNIQAIFLGCSIPVALGFWLILRFVPETTTKKLTDSPAKIKKKYTNPLRFTQLKKLGKRYWVLMGITFVYVLARVGEQFLILHATTNFGLQITHAPIVALLYNIATAIISYPVGLLADRFSRSSLLVAGFLSLIIADTFLAFAPNLSTLMIGVVFWGIQIGITQSVSLTMIAEYTPTELRGTSVGFFHLVNAVGFLISSTIAGNLTKNFDESMAFLCSLFVSVIAFVLLIIAKKRRLI